MRSIAELFTQFSGGLVFIFAAGWLLTQLNAYEEYYNKMLYDDEELKSKNQDEVDNDFTHKVSI